MVSSASQLTATLPSDLKRSNRMQILEKFRSGNTCTASQIAEDIGVSRQTVMKAIQFFMAKGLVVSLGKSHSTSVGGKPPELFSLSTKRCLLSVSLWPDRQHLTLMNLRGEILAARSLPELLSESVDAAMERIGAISGELLALCGVASEALSGVCVSTSGTVNYRTNTLKFNSLRPAWGRNIPIAERLAPYFAPGTPILVENVAKVVGRSILHKPELEHKRMISVFSSWGGVCASFIENDRILNGKDSLIGEIGHMVIAPEDAEECGCGSHGCFERMVSNERLRRNIAATIAAHPESSMNALRVEQIAVGDVFAASARGDAYARELASQLARYFAMALRNVSLVFDPELVVLQGEYAAADEVFCNRLRRALSDFRYYPEGGPFELRLDRRSIDELDVRGARVLLIDHLFNDPELYV